MSNNRLAKLLERNNIQDVVVKSQKQRIEELETLLEEQDEAILELASIVSSVVSSEGDQNG